MTDDEILFFDRIASRWDALETVSVPERINALLDLLNIGCGEHVLDLGTGTGVLLPYLLERVGEEGLVVGVDVSPGMLAEAKRKMGRRQNLRLLERDFEVDMLTGSYDLIVLYCVYPHLHYPEATLRRLLQRNMADGGRIVVAFPTTERFINDVHSGLGLEAHTLVPVDSLAAALAQSGFNATVIDNDLGAYIIEIRQ